MNRKEFFATKLIDAVLTDVEGLGAEREEYDPILGLRKYRWVKNVSAAALTQGMICSWEKMMTGSPFTVTGNPGNNAVGVIQFAAASFTARALGGMFARVHDDAGAAGAAPEGEIHRIRTNTDALISLADDDPLTVPCLVGDTVVIFRPYHVVATADADGQPEVAGIVQAPSLAINSFGWVQTFGIGIANVIAAGTAVAAGALLKVNGTNNNLLTAADAADNGEVVAAALANGVQSDTVLRKALVAIRGWN